MCRGRNGFGKNGNLYRGHICMRVWPCHYEGSTDLMMNRTVKPPEQGEDGQSAQVFFVEGHKVTVRYSREKNPSAIRAIKETLLANVGAKKG